ncbi:MAG: PIN domain-containing protein [Chloroflexota bacterium]|nr:PIN domain-containing protein [Chloroflexota bacterium]
MALIVDAGILYAQADRSDADHARAVELLVKEREALVASELVVAEADYLIRTRLGVDVELAFIEDLASGTYAVDCLSRAELGQAHDLALRYRDLKPGLADCSLVVLAYRYSTHRLATFNQRDFRRMAPLQGGSFVLLPADS